MLSDLDYSMNCKVTLPLQFLQSGFWDFLKSRMKKLGVRDAFQSLLKKVWTSADGIFDHILYLTVIQRTLHAFKLKA